MSIKAFSDRVVNIVLDSKPKVISIYGEWGVGKSFFWKSSITEWTTTYRLEKMKYSYVSLFGVSSIDEIKKSVFENFIYLKDIKDKEGDLRVNRILLSFKKILKKSPRVAGELPVIKPFNSYINIATSKIVANTIVCIDDIERRSKNIDMSEVLGFANYLKEFANCKVVLIINNSNEPEYFKIKEKVVDFGIEFNPSLNDITEITFNKNKHKDILYEFIQDVNLKNIRVIHKIINNIDVVEGYINGLNDGLVIKIIRQICFMTWSDELSGVSDSVPTLKYIFENKVPDGNELSQALAKEWIRMKREYNFIPLTELSRDLHSIITTGRFDIVKFKETISSILEEFEISSGNEKYNTAFDYLVKSFIPGKDDVSFVISIFKENANYLSIYDLESMVYFLRYIGDNGKCTEVIDAFFENRDTSCYSDVNGVSNLDGEIFSKLKSTPGFNKKTNQELTISGVINYIYEKESWSAGYISFLSSLSYMDFVKHFESLEPDELKKQIYTCLRFSEINSEDSRLKEISGNCQNALKFLSGKNKLYEFKASKFRF